MRIVALFVLATLLPLIPFVLWLQRRRGHATRTEVADALEAFLNATGGPHDWDRFISGPLLDPTLEAIRVRCGHLPEEFPPQRPGEYCSDAGRQVIRELVVQLRQRTASDGQD